MHKKKVTLENFLRKTWLPTIRMTIRKSTYLSYESHVRHHVCPHIGGKRPDRIDGSLLNELYAILLERGRRDRGPLAPASVRRVHAMLHRAFRDAVRWGVIARNPTDAADPPRPRANRKVELATWSVTELRDFLQAVREHKLYPLWLLLATTGMRRGEVLGLRWCDVDLEGGEVAIRQTVVLHNYVIAMSEPKTTRGRRVVALDDYTIDVLRRFRQQPPEEPLPVMFNEFVHQSENLTI